MTTALVIDDNRQAADGVCQIVSLLGLQARSAYGAREAMLTLRDNVPDIIFLDIQLPGVDGFEVLSFLRREPRLKDIPVVMVTSDDQPETALKARQTGALLTLIKPVSVETLERVLRTAKLVK